MAETIHDLSAAYALDALEPGELEAFEEHLATCESCRKAVADFSSVAAELAFAGSPASPAPALRDRLLEAARAERQNVVPLRPRWQRPLVAVAAVAACAALGLGLWNVSLHNQLSDSKNEALARLPVTGTPGSMVVSSSGSAALVLYRLDAAPTGKTYEAWVIRGSSAPVPAGLFRGGAGTTFVPIKGSVKRGSVVAVTVEPSGGSPQPTTTPFATSKVPVTTVI
ncbi:MAG TPA: anti-sigma factor [Gaiellaceae bacterium]|nr:anti-sigma factor [Gaiellaceae bacterium]